MQTLRSRRSLIEMTSSFEAIDSAVSAFAWYSLLCSRSRAAFAITELSASLAVAMAPEAGGWCSASDLKKLKLDSSTSRQLATRRFSTKMPWYWGLVERAAFEQTASSSVIVGEYSSRRSLGKGDLGPPALAELRSALLLPPAIARATLRAKGSAYISCGCSRSSPSRSCPPSSASPGTRLSASRGFPYTRTLSTMVTWLTSPLGANRIEKVFVSATWAISARVKGMSNQRLRLMATGMLRLKISMAVGARVGSQTPRLTRMPAITRPEAAAAAAAAEEEAAAPAEEPAPAAAVAGTCVTVMLKPLAFVQATYMLAELRRAQSSRRGSAAERIGSWKLKRLRSSKLRPQRPQSMKQFHRLFSHILSSFCRQLFEKSCRRRRFRRSAAGNLVEAQRPVLAERNHRRQLLGPGPANGGHRSSSSGDVLVEGGARATVGGAANERIVKDLALALDLLHFNGIGADHEADGVLRVHRQRKDQPRVGGQLLPVEQGRLVDVRLLTAATTGGSSIRIRGVGVPHCHALNERLKVDAQGGGRGGGKGGRADRQPGAQLQRGDAVDHLLEDVDHAEGRAEGLAAEVADEEHAQQVAVVDAEADCLLVGAGGPAGGEVHIEHGGQVEGAGGVAAGGIRRNGRRIAARSHPFPLSVAHRLKGQLLGVDLPAAAEDEGKAAQTATVLVRVEGHVANLPTGNDKVVERTVAVLPRQVVDLDELNRHDGQLRLRVGQPERLDDVVVRVQGHHQRVMAGDGAGAGQREDVALLQPADGNQLVVEGVVRHGHHREGKGNGGQLLRTQLPPAAAVDLAEEQVQLHHRDAVLVVRHQQQTGVEGGGGGVVGVAGAQHQHRRAADDGPRQNGQVAVVGRLRLRLHVLKDRVGGHLHLGEHAVALLNAQRRRVHPHEGGQVAAVHQRPVLANARKEAELRVLAVEVLQRGHKELHQAEHRLGDGRHVGHQQVDEVLKVLVLEAEALVVVGDDLAGELGARGLVVVRQFPLLEVCSNDGALYQYLEIRISFFRSLEEAKAAEAAAAADFLVPPLVDLFARLAGCRCCAFGCRLTSARQLPSSLAPQSQKNEPCLE
ncbi:hypothetical protein TYRP_004029 [Tyrophagus putrescentiae]|nr:hypothetical protein TYRP_004029 [Tyrophagus putrescentiae]